MKIDLSNLKGLVSTRNWITILGGWLAFLGGQQTAVPSVDQFGDPVLDETGAQMVETISRLDPLALLVIGAMVITAYICRTWQHNTEAKYGVKPKAEPAEEPEADPTTGG